MDDEQIAPFMEDINRHFEYFDKEDILKKIVSLEFGKFLKYYANAPEIQKPSTSRDRKERGEGRDGRKREKRAPEAGYRRLFINLGKDDGFYPGEVMQFLNRNVHGRQEVGHIDLLARISYIEVPEQDAEKRDARAERSHIPQPYRALQRCRRHGCCKWRRKAWLAPLFRPRRWSHIAP